MSQTLITDAEFSQFQRFMFDTAGISLSPAKKALVAGRLAKRLHHTGMTRYGDYFKLISRSDASAEMQMAIDLLTTNETYFFREPKHFDLLRQLAGAAAGGSFRVWSAASSSGEEAYSIAMVLADRLGDRPWGVLGSDISQRVLVRARLGHYPLSRARNIPPAYLKKFCLKGIGEQQGTLRVAASLRARVEFATVNLNEPLPAIGQFDVVFLRNVMIYFSNETKRQVVARIAGALRPGGHLLIGHSESLHEISGALEHVSPSIYRKPAN